MMLKLWVKAGKLMVDSQGRPILCETCPCETCDAKTPLLQRIVMAWGGYSSWWSDGAYLSFGGSSDASARDAFLASEWSLATCVAVANTVAHRYLSLPLLDSYPETFGTPPPRSFHTETQTNPYLLPTVADGGWLGAETDTCAKLLAKLQELHSVYVADVYYEGSGTSWLYFGFPPFDYANRLKTGTWNESTQSWDYAAADTSNLLAGRWGLYARDQDDPITWDDALALLPEYRGGITGAFSVPASVFTTLTHGYYIWQQTLKTGHAPTYEEGEIRERTFGEFVRSYLYQLSRSIWDPTYADNWTWARPPACAALMALWGEAIDNWATSSMVIHPFGDEWVEERTFQLRTSLNLDGSLVIEQGDGEYMPVTRDSLAMPCNRPATADDADLIQVSDDFYGTEYNLTGASHLYQWIEKVAGYVTVQFADIPTLSMPCAARECDYPYPYPYPYPH